MRRHFSLQRLAIVVAWAALSPQCALFVHSWTGLLSGATVSDAAGIAPDFDGGWNRWIRSSDRPGAVALATRTPPPGDLLANPNSAWGEFRAADDFAVRKFSGHRAIDTHRASSIQGVVMR